MRIPKLSEYRWAQIAYCLSMAVILVIAYFSLGCQSVAKSEAAPVLADPAPVEPASLSFQADWDGRHEAALWTQYTISAVAEFGQPLLTLGKLSDAKVYCPKYASLGLSQRVQVWVMLISAMARHESGFNPETQFKEAFNDRNGKPVISRGLLQLSIESGNGYGCGLKKASELHDPLTNIRCAVRILAKWIPKDGVIGTKKRGGARYWSVLRESKSTRAKIAAKVKALPGCQ